MLCTVDYLGYYKLFHFDLPECTAISLNICSLIYALRYLWFAKLLVSLSSSLCKNVVSSYCYRELTVVCKLSFVSEIECPNPLDLVFLVDDSSSISENDWPRLLNYLRQVTTRFNVSRVATRIGIVRYASDANIIYRLTDSQTQPAVQRAIREMRHLGGSTNLAAAMRVAYQQVFIPATRVGAAKVLYVTYNSKLASIVCFYDVCLSTQQARLDL